MPDKTKLSPEDKMELLLHILSSVDEQNVISFAEDKFEAYFEAFSKPLVEKYLLDLNNKKTLQFMVYGEPGMINEHFIKVSSQSKLAREIKLQLDMIKAKHKDMILMVNDENKALKSALESGSGTKKNTDSNENETSLEEGNEEDDRTKMAAKVNEALDYSKKLSKALKKNKNLQVLEGVVHDTQGYLQTVKLISEDYEAVNLAMFEPIIEENRNTMKKLTLTAAIAIASVSIFSILLLTFFSY